MPKDFENEVQLIASQLWNVESGGPVIIDGKERDGVYVTDDAVHLIECTISRSKDKAIQDVKKLSLLAKKMQTKYPDKAVKGWFITLDEPTPDQRSIANSQGYLTIAISFVKFRSKLIDGNQYISLRDKYAFGSVRDPETGGITFSDSVVEIDLAEYNSEESLWTIDRIKETLNQNTNIVVLGHYGVGKSITLREVYIKLKKEFLKGRNHCFPIYINLRDHHGQTDPVEVLERHSRLIGFAHPYHLVRAWRSGYCFIIIDGFDEMATFGWAAKTTRLKDIRRRSMELIRKFIRDSVGQKGILIAGRSNFFDSITECRSALHLDSKTILLVLGDFNEAQIRSYLAKKNIETQIPAWMPSRPLLVGYLVAKGILVDIIDKTSGQMSPAEGWDLLLDAISEREAAIEAGFDKNMVRDIIEGLASFVRKQQSGLGPIFQQDLEKVFFEKFDYEPDERALTVLQRLPGLGNRNETDGSRYFVDENLADVAKAGEVVKYANAPYYFEFTNDPRTWVETLNELGVQVLRYKLEQMSSSQIQDAIWIAKEKEYDLLASDLILCLNIKGSDWIKSPITIQNVMLPFFEINNEYKWSDVVFRELIIRKLVIDELPELTNSPKFYSCLIGEVIGFSNEKLLPEDIFIDCQFESFDSTNTTIAAILKMDVSLPIKVALTILKKIYMQSGAGRQENALFRGLSVNERGYVLDVLKILRQENLLIASRGASDKVWLPVRDQASRAKQIIINRAIKDSLFTKLDLLVR